MRAGDRCQRRDQHEENGTGRHRIAKQSQRDIPTGKALGHDARADHRCEQECRADKFGKALANERYLHALALRGRTAGCAGGRGWDFRFTTGGTRDLLDGGTLAVHGAFAVRIERLPNHALRIGNPLLFGMGIAAGGVFLGERWPVRLREPLEDHAEFRFILGLDSQMLDAALAAARGDGEVHTRIV